MYSLPTNNAFDAETTTVLASAFDAAWEKIKASDDSLRHEAATRELLAKCIIRMAEQGERDPNRLIEDALDRLAR